MEKIRKTIIQNNLIEKGDYIILGLSGGPDSVCLFFVMQQLSEELGLRGITCVHINHMLRPGEAEKDQHYCEELSKAYGVGFEAVKFDCEAYAEANKITCEEAGRKKRYETFDDIACKIGENVKIAVAHNSDDQAETLLFRIMRGTSTDGLAGMEYKRKSNKGFDIIRPLLDTTRTEIEQICADNNLNPRIDMTNLQPVYTRNKIRLELLPYIAQNFNSGILESLLRLAASATEDKDFMSVSAKAAYDDALKTESPGRVELSLESLQAEHPALRKRILMRALAICGLEKDIERVHINAADELIKKGITGKTAEFPRGFNISVSYDSVIVTSPDQGKKQMEVSLKTTHMTPAEYEAELHRLKASKVEYAAFDAIKLSGAGVEPNIRTRRGGDWIAVRKPDGSIGRKKIQDLFTDMKIPREMREELLLAAVGSEIIYIPLDNIKSSKIRGKYTVSYEINDETKEIVLLEISRGLC
ncbi:MAG: tRNA lysidine(34) synthetase TilS [Eubacteriales bacterium]|nr:tRNA lysidine(34) synthetase TilS [Eubacteriales bacterium]